MALFYYYLHIKEMNRPGDTGLRGPSEISGQESAAWEVGEGEIASGLNIIVYLFVA